MSAVFSWLLGGLNFVTGALKSNQLNVWGAANPKILGGLSGIIFGGLGDVLAQSIEVKQTRLSGWTDSSRTFLVSTYCGVAAFYFWQPFVVWLDDHFGETGFNALMLKVLVDNGIALPFIDIPAFYLFTVVPRIGITEAFAKFKMDWRDSVFQGWILWIPANTLIFGLLPQHLRVPVIYVVDTVWAFDLSHKSNNNIE
jgi:hypothetical protein